MMGILSAKDDDDINHSVNSGEDGSDGSDSDED